MQNFLKDSQISGGYPLLHWCSSWPASCLYLCLFFYCNLLINVRNVAILESLILLGFKRFFRGICLYSCLFSSFLSVLKTLAIVLRSRTEQAATPAPYRVIKLSNASTSPVLWFQRNIMLLPFRSVPLMVLPSTSSISNAPGSKFRLINSITLYCSLVLMPLMAVLFLIPSPL